MHSKELEQLTRDYMATIPGFPRIDAMTTEECRVTAKCHLEDGTMCVATMAWHFSTGQPEQGFARGHLAVGHQEWIVRPYRRANGSTVFLHVGSPNTGRPHRLFYCQYDFSGQFGTCSFCGKKGVYVKQGEYSGIPLVHIMRCQSCQPKPCGEPVTPFDKELALPS